MNRIMIAGTNSGCGKTTVTCAVLQALVNRGMKPSSFKCGPDYIDPMFHSKIIGINSRNLDSVFCDKNTLNFLLNRTAWEMSVIEGVMGYYDGVDDKHSSCQVALETKTPVIIVIDCKGMSMSIGAVMKGFLSFKTPNNICGFIFNRLPESLIDMAKNLCDEMNVEYLGRFPFSKDCTIESRHLGLVSDMKIDELKLKMQKLSELAEENLLIDKIIDIAKTAEVSEFIDVVVDKLTDKPLRIAVASDDAFCFCYEDNLDLLRELGCEIVRFSPVHDKCLPENIGGLILVGGYPELYAERLSENKSMLLDIKNKIMAGLPTVAECGGFMYLNKYIESDDGKTYDMVGVVDGKAYKTDRLRRFGYVSLTAEKDNLLCKKGESIKAHEFHYWDSTDCGNGFEAVKVSNGLKYSCVHSSENLYAGFPHLYFYSNPKMAENFVKRCKKWIG